MATSADDLTPREIVAIGRLLYEGVSSRMLAKAFGVPTSAIIQAADQRRANLEATTHRSQPLSKHELLQMKP